MKCKPEADSGSKSQRSNGDGLEPSTPAPANSSSIPLDERPWSEFIEIRNLMERKGVLFHCGFSGLARHLLSHFTSTNVFQLSTPQLRELFCELNPGDEQGEIPRDDDEFHAFICERYLDLEREPRSSLLELYEDAAADIREIRARLGSYDNEITTLKNREQANSGFNDDDDARMRLLRFYEKTNREALDQILDFLVSGIQRHALRKAEKSWGMGLSLAFGLSTPYPYRWFTDRNYDVESFSWIRNKFGQLPSRRRREVEKAFREEPANFIRIAAQYIARNDVVQAVVGMTSANHRLDARKEILRQLLDAYITGQKELFIGAVPSQIEGIIRDIRSETLPLAEAPRRGSITGDLQAIRQHFPQFFGFAYYSCCFPVIRNRFAHGKLPEQDLEELSQLLLLDLHDVCRKICSEHLPVNALVGLVKNTEEDTDDYSALAKFASMHHFGVPDLYGLDHKMEELSHQLCRTGFWEYLKKIAAVGDPEIEAGLRQILENLSKRTDLSDGRRELKSLVGKRRRKGSHFSWQDFWDKLPSLDHLDEFLRLHSF